jgi:DnaJ domain
MGTDARGRQADRPGGDPYRTLGVSATASDGELRAAYRRLVQLHHPDHNAGSLEAARRFEEVQTAYAQIRELRARRPEPPISSVPPPHADPHLESRLADLERELREAAAAREQARAAARQAAAAATGAQAAGGLATGRATDEELGYIKTDDSLAKIFADARDELADRLSGPEAPPAARRVADLIDELDDFAGKFRRPPGRGGGGGR